MTALDPINGPPVTVASLPTGARPWRSKVAAAAEGTALGAALRLRFTLPPDRWVDLDTLVAATVAGLADARAADPRRLQGILATKSPGRRPGLRATPAPSAALRDARLPGRPAVAVTHPLLPRPGDMTAKVSWRDAVAAAVGRPLADAAVWADVELGTAGPLLARLEPVLDGLEPALGRDPRGRARQVFFPNDDGIAWLRVRRLPAGAGVRLRLGIHTTAVPAAAAGGG